MSTVGEDVEGLPGRVQAGEAGGLWGDGPPALQRCLQRGGPVGDHTQRLPPHRHHLRPFRPRLVGVRLLDWRSEAEVREQLANIQRSCTDALWEGSGDLHLITTATQGRMMSETTTMTSSNQKRGGGDAGAAKHQLLEGMHPGMKALRLQIIWTHLEST